MQISIVAAAKGACRTCYTVIPTFKSEWVFLMLFISCHFDISPLVISREFGKFTQFKTRRRLSNASHDLRTHERNRARTRSLRPIDKNHDTNNEVLCLSSLVPSIQSG
jgi:hypothetical protein